MSMKLKARIDRVSIIPVKTLDGGTKYQFGFELDKMTDEEWITIKHCVDEGGAEIIINPVFVESIRKSKESKKQQTADMQMNELAKKLRKKREEKPIIIEE